MIQILLHLSIVMLMAAPVYAADNKKNDQNESANEIAQILDNMGYPELQVVPRASERLRIEAKAERGAWFLHHWPTELAGAATLTVGLMGAGSQKEDLSSDDKRTADSVVLVTKAVGLGWIVGGLVLGAQYPYLSGMRTIAKYPGKDDRSILTRERLAEEALEKPARTMRVLKHFSVFSNFAINAANFPYLNSEGKVIAGVGAILSFLPYMFEDHTVNVFDKHIEYKRKIYAPIKSASFIFDSEYKTLTPMTHLEWFF